MGFNQAFLNSEIVRAHSTKKNRPAKGIAADQIKCAPFDAEKTTLKSLVKMYSVWVCRISS